MLIRNTVVWAIISLALVLSVGQVTHALTLARDGKTDYTIVLADKAIPAEKTAADELRGYLNKITGAEFPLCRESEPTRGILCIYVGPTEFAGRNRVTPAGPEEWSIKTMGENLVLTGGRPRGTLYAVYRFLEDYAGVRWWTIWEESVPSKKTFSIPAINKSGKPAFIYREVYDSEIPPPKPFYARNRVNGYTSFLPAEYGGTVAYGPPYFVHTFGLYFPPDQYFDAHPDYYSMVGGERRRDAQLCLTNPELRRAFIEKVRANIESSHEAARSQGLPPPVLFSVTPNDWKGSCECKNCRAVVKAEGESGLLLSFVNRIADAVREEHPDVLIDTLAYQYYVSPPKTVRPRDNVCIRLCDIEGDLLNPLAHPLNKHGYDNLLGWSKITKHLRIWDYATTYDPNLPLPSMFNLQDDLRLFRKYGVEGIFFEQEFPVQGDMRDMKVWLEIKLMEDPDRNLSDLIKDFTDGYYGAAGRYVRTYLSRLRRAASREDCFVHIYAPSSAFPYMGLDLVRDADRVFDEAENAVANDRTLLYRVRLARLPLDRAIVHRWRYLVREHLDRGGAIENMPVDRKAAARRAADTLKTVTDMRFPPDLGDKSAPLRKEALDEAADLENSADRSVAIAPLPQEFRNLPRDAVTEFTADIFRLYPREKALALVDDPESPTGQAARLRLASTSEENRTKYLVSDSHPLVIGHYNFSSGIFGKSAEFHPDDIAGPGYNLYKLGSVKILPSEYFYVFWSWVIQVILEEARSNNPNDTYDIYASVKFEGPSFPKGDPSKEDAIYVDRVIAVRSGGGKH